LKELDDYSKNPIVGIQIFADPQNQHHLTATLDGPSDSVYENGQFKLDVVFPQDYPFKPPNGTAFDQAIVKFKT
jgi:ubiquitin-conjugating enzyme E2 D/E